MRHARPKQSVHLGADVVVKAVPKTQERLLLGLICLAAFVLRVGYRVHLGSDDFWTNGYTFYYGVAENLAAGKGLWSDSGGWAMRPPVYPGFLALTALTGGNYLSVVIPQALMGVGTVLCAFLIGEKLFHRDVGLIAAALAAVYPYYIVHDTALQETSMMTFLSALSVYLLLRAKTETTIPLCLSVGAALCAAVLVRTTMLPFALAALAWIAVFGDGAPGLKLRRVALILLPLLAGVGGWLVRNEIVIGRPVLSSEAGFQFWVAHNPDTFSKYPRESIDRSRDVALQALSQPDKSELVLLSKDELRRDDWFLKKGEDYVRQHPGRTAFDALRKIAAGFSWSLNPEHDSFAQFVYFVSYAPLLLLGAAGMALTFRRWREHGVIYVQFLAFVFVSALFWAHTNHRTHLDVFLIVFASFTLERVSALLRKAGRMATRLPGQA